MTTPIRLAIVGLGKIARDQHVPAIAADPAFSLVATVGPEGGPIGSVPHLQSLDDLAASGIAVDAVALCTPPQVRRALALAAIDRGWHVLLEKPPATTLSEAKLLIDAAAAAGVTLFAAWHSRFAAGVEPARAWLADRTIRGATITWREDVRVWHPGQDWIFAAGGFGVFDPGINALSIATHILPRPFFAERAELDAPANRAAPIAARVDFRDTGGAPIAMDLDFRQEGEQTWTIAIDTDAGTLRLADGGARLTLPDGSPAQSAGKGEYSALYDRFAALIRDGGSDADLTPLRHVADICLRAEVRSCEPFI